MMKKFLISSLSASLLLFSAFSASAQDEENNKIKIDVTVTKDGKTKHIIKEIDLSNAENLKELMEQVDGLEDIDISVEDGAIEVIVRKKDGERSVSSYTFPQGFNMSGINETKNIAFMGIIGGMEDGEVVLTKIIDDGPAEKAGFKKNDVVKKFDGDDVRSYEHLVDLIHAKEIGDEVKVKIERKGKSKKLDLVLGERKSNLLVRGSTGNSAWLMEKDMRLQMEEIKKLQSINSDKGFLGIHFEMDNPNGVLVTKVVDQSAADKEGIIVNDILIKLNGQTIANAKAFTELMKDTKKGDEVEIELLREGELVSKKVTLGQRVMAFQINGVNVQDNNRNYFITEDHADEMEIEDRVMIKILIQELDPSEVDMIHKALGLSNSSDFDNIDVKVFPNPGEGRFKLEANIEGVEDLEIHVFNTAGEKVFTSNNSSSTGEFDDEIDITDLPSGVYFLAIRSGEKVFTEKLIKN